jgi:hypothetical protein
MAERGLCQASIDTRLSRITRDRTSLPCPCCEEFLYCVKAAGYAGGSAASGRACGLRPVPPYAAPSLGHSDLQRPTPRDIRHVLFDALGASGTPPQRPIEFDALLKDVLSERFPGPRL